MYIFEAHYINMDNDTETVKTIKFDGQFIGNERECYIYAMEKAYDMAEKNELLVNVEFIAC